MKTALDRAAGPPQLIPMSAMAEPPLLFAPDPEHDLPARVAAVLGLALSPLEERRFEDGEAKARPLCEVRGRDVYLIDALLGEPGASVHDKLCRLWFLIATLRDAGAARVTVVASYLAYARKDRRTQPRDPVTSRYLAQLFEAVGTDAVVALEVHNPAAFDNGFRCRALHLEAREALVAALLPHLGDRPITVVSPDPGGVKRAERLRLTLAERTGRPPAHAFIEKHRSEDALRGDAVVGEIGGAVAVIVDDMISTGATLTRAVRACRARGARAVYALATHALFAPGAEALLAEDGLDRLIVTDSVAPRLRDRWRGLVERVSVAPLLADAISGLHAEVPT